MGKNSNAYIQRTGVNKVEQKPKEIKFKISQPLPKKGCHNHKRTNRR